MDNLKKVSEDAAVLGDITVPTEVVAYAPTAMLPTDRGSFVSMGFDGDLSLSLQVRGRGQESGDVHDEGGR